jgi:hypothetical protein
MVATFKHGNSNAGAMRRIVKRAPSAFAACGIQLLSEGSDSPGYSYLITLLLKTSQFFCDLCDPAKFSYEEAIALSHRLIKADARFDTLLAQQLPKRSGMDSPLSEMPGAIERALELLDEVSAGGRVVATLSHLTEHPDKKISSKAALLLGKRIQNLAWAKRIISEGRDRRLRANAIESIWGSKSPEVNALFRTCLRDRDNRVVGNSIVGLYLAGDKEVPGIVQRFAGNDEPDFRMTAAWAMGKLADPSYVATLKPLIKDTSPAVRRAALRSLHEIRKSVSSANLIGAA